MHVLICVLKEIWVVIKLHLVLWNHACVFASVDATASRCFQRFENFIILRSLWMQQLSMTFNNRLKILPRLLHLLLSLSRLCHKILLFQLLILLLLLIRWMNRRQVEWKRLIEHCCLLVLVGLRYNIAGHVWVAGLLLEQTFHFPNVFFYVIKIKREFLNFYNKS